MRNDTGTLRLISNFTPRQLHSSLMFSVALRKSVCVVNMEAMKAPSAFRRLRR